MNREGIGLGLTIVKQIVEKSGGKITVYSEGVGKGSTFSFNMKMNTINQPESDTEQHPLLMVVDKSAKALNTEFVIKSDKQKRKGMRSQSSDLEDPIFLTNNAKSKNTFENSSDSADVVLSLTDEVRPPVIPVTTPCQEFYNDCIDEPSHVDDSSNSKSARSPLREIEQFNERMGTQNSPRLEGDSNYD